MEALEVRGLVWQARSTVRTLRCCTRVRVNGIPMKKYRDDAPVFVVTRVVTRVVSMGVNECITPPRALGDFSFPFSFPLPLPFKQSMDRLQMLLKSTPLRPIMPLMPLMQDMAALKAKN